MPKRKPRKPKAPPVRDGNIVNMAGWKEEHRIAQVRANQLAFLALPKEVQRQILIDLLSVSFGFKKKEAPAVEAGPTDGPSAPSRRSEHDEAE